MIQLQKGFGIESNVGTTTLNYISNYGYGGIIGVVGIKDLLLNMGTINIDIIEQNSPVNFEVKKNKPSTVGIYNCVQNGFSCLNPTNNPDDKSKDLLYSYLPPYPPQHYTKEGNLEPRSDNHEINIKYKLNDPTKGLIEKQYKTYCRYDQGHISIYLINNFGMNGTVAEGINRYGGLSYDTDIFSESSLGVTDVTYYIYDFVKKNVNASIMWSFPTAVNTSYKDSVLNNQGQGYYTTANLKDTGWYSISSLETQDTSYAPTQLYYAFKRNFDADYNNDPFADLGKSSDIIFFPINWGVVTIDSVATGKYNLNDGTDYGFVNIDKDTGNIGGLSYGIERLITSIGKIQILNISSSTINHNNDKSFTTTDIKKVNTPERPEISRDCLGVDSYTDLPVNFAKIEIVDSIEGIICNDMPVIMGMKHNCVSDPTSKPNAVLNNRTERSINYRFPYEMIHKTKWGSDYLTLDIDFYVDPNTDTFEEGFIDEGNGENLLDHFRPPGSAYGVFRTLDYGCNSPGLKVLADFTTPFRESSNKDDFLKGFPSAHVKPFEPTEPCGMSLINAGYMGTRNCYNMGGFAIKLWNNKLKSLRNTTIEQDREEWENSPYVGIQHYKMQIPCIAYIYPETYEPLLWDGKKIRHLEALSQYNQLY